MGKIKLLFLPYAGGSSAIYKRWEKYLHKSTEVFPIELPGRGDRYDIPYNNSMEETVDDVYKLFCNKVGFDDYAIFGHSMGCLIAYELACKVINNGLKRPSHIFFSGSCPPHAIKYMKGRHLFPDEVLLEEALKLGGIDEKYLRFKAIVNQFICTLKADYKIIDSYECSGRINRFNFEISVFSSDNDPFFSKNDMNLWDDYTTKKCHKYEFGGGHFFIHDYAEDIAGIINKTLAA